MMMMGFFWFWFYLFLFKMGCIGVFFFSLLILHSLSLPCG